MSPAVQLNILLDLSFIDKRHVNIKVQRYPIPNIDMNTLAENCEAEPTDHEEGTAVEKLHTFTTFTNSWLT